MNVAMEFFDTLYRNLREELHEANGHVPDDIGLAFYRALSHSLDGATPSTTTKRLAPGSAAARARGKKAAATRKANKEKGEQDASSASN